VFFELKNIIRTL